MSLAEAYVAADAASRGERATIEFRYDVEEEAIPDGADGAHWVRPGRDALRGSFNLVLAWTQGDTVLGKLRIPVRVRTYGQVVVAARSVARHTVLAAQDVATEERETTSARSVVDDPVDVIGMRTRRSIAAGEILCTSHLGLPPTVKRGDRVELIVTSGGLTVKAVVEAREDGWPGDRIRVRHIGARSEVKGLVMEDGTLRMESGG
jgi:flagella basal body P-ring formation protein FlgA